MKRILVSCVLVTALFGCGGGSEKRSSIDGSWSGDLIYTGASCLDGSFIGAGSGTVIRQMTLEVNGSDEIGSPVSAIDGDCQLQGVRTSEGFTASPESGCGAALVSVDFILEPSKKATLRYHQDITKVVAEPGQPVCLGGQYAALMR